MSSNNILVTGGMGQIGSYVVDRLIKEKFNKIIILDNLSSNKIDQPPSGTKFIKGDILNISILKDIFKNFDIDGIVHTAAQISISDSLHSPKMDAHVNILGTINILDMAYEANINNLVTVGSAASIGEPEYLPIDNNHPINPITPYGISKASAELYTLNYAKRYNLSYNVVRPFNVYSERIKTSDIYSGVIANFIEAAIQGLPFNIHGDGYQSRDFIHAEDVAKTILKILEKKSSGKVYNACTGISTSINDLSRIISEVFNVELIQKYIPKRESDIKVSVGEKPEILNESFVKITDGIRRIFEDKQLRDKLKQYNKY